MGLGKLVVRELVYAIINAGVEVKKDPNFQFSFWEQAIKLYKEEYSRDLFRLIPQTVYTSITKLNQSRHSPSESFQDKRQMQDEVQRIAFHR